mmetsp:Transcript_359/g.345  ORF Transcript_359/g.345 Transcript_359/m.345 type:complete len:227 (+) Transcript_359:118-798(+)
MNHIAKILMNKNIPNNSPILLYDSKEPTVTPFYMKGAINFFCLFFSTKSFMLSNYSHSLYWASLPLSMGIANQVLRAKQSSMLRSLYIVSTEKTDIANDIDSTINIIDQSNSSDTGSNSSNAVQRPDQESSLEEKTHYVLDHSWLMLDFPQEGVSLRYQMKDMDFHVIDNKVEGKYIIVTLSNFEETLNKQISYKNIEKAYSNMRLFKYKSFFIDNALIEGDNNRI